jgi:hypothetical protein
LLLVQKIERFHQCFRFDHILDRTQMEGVIRFLAVFNGIDLRMNGWNSAAPGAMVKSTGNGRGSILGLIPGRLPPGENPRKFAGQTHFSSVKYKYRHCLIPMPIFEAF